jgi:hypothetical protein
MERSFLIVVLLGLAAAVGLALFSPYLSVIALIIAAVVLMTIAIGRDTVDLPDIEITLAEDARSILLRNTGNAPALQVHTSLVPSGVEFDVVSIPPEEIHEERLPEQMAEVKVVVRFKNNGGRAFQRTAVLSALHPQTDPFKPMFGIFGSK